MAPWAMSWPRSRAIGSLAFHASISSSVREIGLAVALGMRAPAVGLALDQRRSFARHVRAPPRVTAAS